jgi:hypothetical protein
VKLMRMFQRLWDFIIVPGNEVGRKERSRSASKVAGSIHKAMIAMAKKGWSYR